MPNPETVIQNTVRLAASDAGAVLFRNNVGLAWRRDGVPVKFGLARGSSDLIGWTPRVITPDMVGDTVAVFTAIEVKTPRGRVTKPQANFLERVDADGGIAILARGADIVKEKLGHAD